MSELAIQMDEVIAQQLRGEISQEEALQRQRTLLGAEIEQPTTEQSPPAVSLETKVEVALARLAAQKADAIEKLKLAATRAAEIESERQRIQGAISVAESKSKILSGSPSQYQTERANLIAAGLMGTAVDVEKLREGDQDFGSALTAQDLALGIRALRSQLQEIEGRKGFIEADKRKASHQFFEAHAHQNQIRFAFLATQMRDAYCAIQGAHRAALSLGDRFSVLAPDSLANLHVNNPLSDALMRELGIGWREMSGRVIEQTNSVNVAANQMFSEMNGGAA